jgi:hypothetical protein
MNINSEAIGEGIKRIVSDLNATISGNGGKKGSFYILIACATHEDTDHNDDSVSSTSYYSTNVEDSDFMSDILDDFYESHCKESRIMQSKKRKAELGDTFIENWIS